MLLYLDISYHKFEREGQMHHLDDLELAIHDGAVKRIRPKTMTVMAALFGLVPIMIGADTGADTMKRMAAPDDRRTDHELHHGIVDLSRYFLFLQASGGASPPAGGAGARTIRRSALIERCRSSESRSTRTISFPRSAWERRLSGLLRDSGRARLRPSRLGEWLAGRLPSRNCARRFEALRVVWPMSCRGIVREWSLRQDGSATGWGSTLAAASAATLTPALPVARKTGCSEWPYRNASTLAATAPPAMRPAIRSKRSAYRPRPGL